MPLEAPYGGEFSPHNLYLAVYMREWATELMLSVTWLVSGMYTSPLSWHENEFIFNMWINNYLPWCLLYILYVWLYLSENFTEHALNNNIIVLRPHNTSIMKIAEGSVLHVRKTIKLSLIYVRGAWYDSEHQTVNNNNADSRKLSAWECFLRWQVHFIAMLA